MQNEELNVVKEDLITPEVIYPEYQYAETWQRFVNWLIDNLLMRFGLSIITGMMLGLILGLAAPQVLEDLASDMSGGTALLFAYIIAIFNYTIYYTLCEKLFKGYTLGKLITGTRAIRQDGDELTFKDAFLRSLIRLIPFEVFSGFSTLTWHDDWTNKMVIKSR